MDLATARARIHGMFTTDDQAAAELDQRLDDLVAAALSAEHTTKTPVTFPENDGPRCREPWACFKCGQLPQQWCPGCSKCACVPNHSAGCANADG